MSENLNRSPGNFSKYDSMSIEELEAVLRADAEAPDGPESDVDEILYVMEVLANKRRTNGIAGKTALEAYELFQQHYLPNKEENTKSVPEQKPRKILYFRHLSTIAATLAIVVSLSMTANAFSWDSLWNVVATWAKETFSFSVGQVEASEPLPSDNLGYASLQDALAELDFVVDVPIWIPDGYVLSDIIIDKNPKQETLLAVYENDGKVLKISVQSYFAERPEQIEMSVDFVELYTASGIDYYIFSNHTQNRAVWIVDSYECYISGELTIANIKLMIDSIMKG